MSVSPTIELRQAQASDAAALRAILRDTFESTWRPNVTEAGALAFLNEDRPTAYVAERGLDFWVCELDGEVVGLIHWRCATPILLNL